MKARWRFAVFLQLLIAVAVTFAGEPPASPPTPTITALAPLATEDPPLPHAAHPQKPSSLWSNNVRFPFPTNSWWINAVLENGDSPVYNKPYSIQFTQGNSVVVGYPRKYIQPDGHFLAQWFEYGLGVNVCQPGETSTHQVVAADSLSLAVEYRCGSSDSKGKGQAGSSPSAGPVSGNSSSVISTMFPVVRGTPYLTAIYRNGGAPSLSFVRCELKEVQEYPTRSKASTATLPGGELRMAPGSSFLLRLNTSQTWILYSDRVSQFWWNSTAFFAVAKDRAKGSAAKPWIIRVAALPSSNSLEPAKSILDRGSDCIPMSATLVTEASESALYARIKWNSQPAYCKPLILALPHSQDLLSPKDHEYTRLKYDNVLGSMMGIFAEEWVWTEPFITPNSFFGTLRQTPMDPDKVSALVTQLKADLKFIGFSPDPYDFGKQVCRFARLALIAEELGQSELHAKALQFVQEAFQPWMAAESGDAITYDTSWGGTPPKMGMMDPGADFGAGYYNDHHFHYGYWLYAAAVLAKNNSAWAAQTKPFFLALARDIANPSVGDAYFPPFRNFDWFEGHGMASGLFPFFDGRNQESSSEALNAWYGLALYGATIQDSNVERTGRALLVSEMRSTQRYWRSTSRRTVYPELFARRLWTGMVWCGKVVDNTWFGAGPLYSLGINLIPFTPLTEHYVRPDWVKEAYPLAKDAMANEKYSSDWTSLVYLMHAVLDPEASWKEIANSEVRGDEGMSRTNAMWWIASRPDKPSAYLTLDRNLGFGLSPSSSLVDWNENGALSLRGGHEGGPGDWSGSGPGSGWGVTLHKAVITLTLVTCVAGFLALVGCFVASTKSPTRLWPIPASTIPNSDHDNERGGEEPQEKSALLSGSRRSAPKSSSKV